MDQKDNKTNGVVLNLVSTKARRKIDKKLETYKELLSLLYPLLSAPRTLRLFPSPVELEPELIVMTNSRASGKAMRMQFVENPRSEMLVIIFLHYFYSGSRRKFEEWMVDTLPIIHVSNVQLISFYALLWAGTGKPQRLYNLIAKQPDMRLLSNLTERFYRRTMLLE